VTEPPSSRSAAAPRVPGRGVVVTGYAAFTLLGWTMLLVPSLIREVQRDFDQSDAGMGLAYLLFAVAYVSGSVGVGVLAGRMPRRPLLAAGPMLVSAGMVTIAVAGGWTPFLAGYLAMALGAGVIDAGTNALFLDLFAGRAAMINRLHMFFALGALGAPLAVGLSLSSGMPWQGVALLTAGAALLIGAVMATRRLPAGQDRPQPLPDARAAAAPTLEPAASAAPAPAPPSPRRRLPLPLILLAIAIACYVAAELGISSWLVRYLEDAPVLVATLALSLFWAAIGLGRLVSSLIGDRLSGVSLAAGSAVVCGLAILAAVVAPTLALSVACFTVAGFAAGPVYPSVMSLGGALYPGRSSMVSSVLTSAGIVGSLVYPPLIGVASEAAGLWVGIAGAGLLAFAAGASTYAAARSTGSVAG
jgi:fucose permease